MSEPANDTGELFRFFVMQHQMTAMIYMGKVMHPATGQIERNLEGARLSIDLLGMLQEKTKGNLTEDESKLLQQVLTSLRLNYVEEARREPPPAEEKEEAAGPGNADNTRKTADEGQGPSEPQAEPGGGAEPPR